MHGGARSAVVSGDSARSADDEAQSAEAVVSVAAPSGRVPVLEGVNIAGITEAKFGGFPPDGDIAVSQSYVLHIVNFGVSIYNKAGTLLKQVSFATFFNNNTDFFSSNLAFISAILAPVGPGRPAAVFSWKRRDRAS